MRVRLEAPHGGLGDVAANDERVRVKPEEYVEGERLENASVSRPSFTQSPPRAPGARAGAGMTRMSDDCASSDDCSFRSVSSTTTIKRGDVVKWSTLATVSLTSSAGPAGMTTASAVLLKRSHFSLLTGKSLRCLLARCGNVPRRFNIGLESVQRDVGVPASGVTRTGRSTRYWTTEVILDVSINDAASRSPWVAHNELPRLRTLQRGPQRWRRRSSPTACLSGLPASTSESCCRARNDSASVQSSNAWNVIDPRYRPLDGERSARALAGARRHHFRSRRRTHPRALDRRTASANLCRSARRRRPLSRRKGAPGDELVDDYGALRPCRVCDPRRRLLEEIA